MLSRGGTRCVQGPNRLPRTKSAEITPKNPHPCIRPSITIEKAWELEDRESLSHLKTIMSSWSSWIILAGRRPRAIGKTYIRPSNIARFDSRENTSPLSQRDLRKYPRPWPETRTWITQRYAGKHILVRSTKAASCRLRHSSPHRASNCQPTCDVDDRHLSPLSATLRA